VTIKVFIAPDFYKSTETGGIRRVVEAMIKYLPAFGVEHTRNLNEASVIINHGAMMVTDGKKPSINVNHGLYWSRQPWGDGTIDVNRRVVESMKVSVAHTAPSEWVSRAIRRGGLFYPKVVYHGVDADEFAPQVNEKYVLWNKARADFVSDPADMMRVAELMPRIPFKTTIGRKTGNVEVIHPTSYERMKGIVARAGVYLCTARETFGIGTLEALAAGVPVAGWDWGGQSEIIEQGETGYLAAHGDFEELAICVDRCLNERGRLSVNAIADSRERWGWKKRIGQYAQIVKRVYEDFYEKDRPTVSVIVTAYELDRFLPKCLESVSKQSFDDFECFVVDDAQLESTKIIVDEFAKKDERIRYLAPEQNLGLPMARNFGFKNAKGRYIRYLDADDFLAENALELEARALDDDAGAHIVYGHLETVREDGSRILDKSGAPMRSGWPPDEFDWLSQMAHLNQLPSCVMMRREVLERSGGYRERMKRAEDAEFWCRVTSLGFVAKKFTRAVTYFHRQLADSKGALEWKNEGKEPDWTAFFPWRMGAGDYEAGNVTMRKSGGRHTSPPLVPFGAQGLPKKMKFWYIHDYAYPVVSVIVTVGPEHERFLLDALDSVLAQSYPDWECIVVNDTGTRWENDIMGAPFAQVVNMDGNQGASAARNKGFEFARGEYVVWLDADDMLLPWFLERTVAYAERNDGVIFSDFIQDSGDGLEVYRYPRFYEGNVIGKMGYAGSSVLIPRKIVEAVLENQGGWDCKIPGMEDWDYQIAIHDAGFCAYGIDEALFVYRTYSSTKREKDARNVSAITSYVDKKWKKYRKDGEIMACGCRKKKIVNTKPTGILRSSGVFENVEAFIEHENGAQMVRVEYLGPIEQTFSIRSRVAPGVTYRFGNNKHKKTATVFLQDAEFLVGRVDGNNHPLYRMVRGAKVEERDPQAVLGRKIG